MTERRVGEVLRTEVKIEWKIPNFFSVPEDVDDAICSDSFAFRGGTWYILLYPNGETEHQSEDYISIFLARKDKGPPRTVTFTLSLKSTNGTLEELFKDTQTLHNIECFGWGIPNALRKSELLEKKDKLAPSGVLTVVCLLRMFPESIEQSENVEVAVQTQSEHLHSEPESPKASVNVIEVATQTPSECSIEKLSRNLNELLVSGEDSDLTVKVKGKEFRLHRGIMGARTPVFHSMFRHEMQEKATGIVSIDDCEVDVFRAFVYYVYSGKMDELCTETVFDLYVLADKYHVDELKSACFDFIQRTLSVDTFCDVVILALTYEKHELLQQATTFLSDNMTAVMKTVKWMNFLKNRYIEANELMLKAVSLKLN